MDTILFFYRKKDLKEAFVEPVGLKSHMLIRVGLNVGEGEWFGIRPDMSSEGERAEKDALKQEALPGQEEYRDSLREKLRGFAGGFLRLFGCFREQRERRHQRGKASQRERRHREREEALLREKRCREREERICAIRDGMRKLSWEILELIQEGDRCFAVYEDGIRKALVGRGESFGDFPEPGAERGDRILPFLWRRYMDFAEFSGYTQPFWVGLLLPHAVYSHYVILGVAPCIPAILEQCAPRMKSLKWVLPESSCGQEILEFVEDFYLEYGLAISLRTLPDETGYQRLDSLCTLPSNIFDFAGGSCLKTADIAVGSVWLDFGSVEEKKRRIEGRCPGVAYFSLKDKWRRAQRRCKEPLLPESLYYLDTCNKSGYNTGES